VLVQDIGLGGRGFLMNNEAYVSQYIDHHIADHARCGPVIMSRQNQAQGGRYPWMVHGCLDGATGFATDAMQIFGPAYRDAAEIDHPFGVGLPSRRLQHEVACAAVKSKGAVLKPGVRLAQTFFGLYEPDHPAASSDQDLARIDAVLGSASEFAPRQVELHQPARSIVQDAPPAATRTLSDEDVAAHFPQRQHEERKDGQLLSFFTPDASLNRHVVLRDKDKIVPRRHGTLLRSGQGMLLDDSTLCATCWMHGVFGAQLTIGNTSFHKLFSVSRDPYNITRASGLRILPDLDQGWRHLALPSAFDTGLSACRWIYRFEDRTITVHAIASGDDAAMQWQIAVEGKPCRFLVYGHLVLGERELDHAGRIEVDAARRRL